MYVATLIANPSKAHLTNAIVMGVAEKMGATSGVALADGIAYDILLQKLPLDLDAIWQDLQKNEIDLVAQPVATRRKKLLLADMDSTMHRLARANVFDSYAPVLNEEQYPQYWLDQEGAPKAKLDNEMPQGTTVPYDEMMEAWMAAGTRQE